MMTNNQIAIMVLAGIALACILYYAYNSNPKPKPSSQPSSPGISEAPGDEDRKEDEYPLQAFKNGKASGETSFHQFASDLLTLNRDEKLIFKTDSMVGSIKYEGDDRWVLESYSENNDSHTINYESWGELTSKLGQYYSASSKFIVTMEDGSSFSVGELDRGVPKKMDSARDESDFSSGGSGRPLHGVDG